MMRRILAHNGECQGQTRGDMDVEGDVDGGGGEAKEDRKP
jgi:hypothetical protein